MYYQLLESIGIAKAGEFVREIDRDEKGIKVETLDNRASFYVTEKQIQGQVAK